MIWVIVIIIVIYILFRFGSDVNKDKYDLQTQLHEKFKMIISEINNVAFNGQGIVTYKSQREFSLYKHPSNQIVFFQYGTGILTIIWRYKYFQKEVVYNRSFSNSRNLSIFEQLKIAEVVIFDMMQKVEKHQHEIIGSIDNDDYLIKSLRGFISSKSKY